MVTILTSGSAMAEGPRIEHRANISIIMTVYCPAHWPNYVATTFSPSLLILHL